MEDRENWLLEAPKYTTIRVNTLKKFDDEVLVKCLKAQAKELNVSHTPKFYYLSPDCLILERWPTEIMMEKTNNEVLVDVSCAAAVLRGAHVFAPGVLGLPSHCQSDEKVDIYGDLEGQCKRGLKVKYDGKKIYVGTGYLKMTRNDLFVNVVHPSGIAVHTLLPASRLPVVNETLTPIKGEILLQNLPSIVCGWVVGAQYNECILDMCSAPGNKTTHLAEMSHNKAIIIAIDKTPQKVAKIKENCDRHGITCVKAYVFDSTKCYSEDSDDIMNGPPFPSNSFDKVLLDAPCSGLGQRPQLGKKMSPKMLQSYKFIQRKLFCAAVPVLKLGGKLIYSTCTITEDENERMVAWVLEKFPCLKLVPSEPLLGGPGLPNVGLSDEERVMVQRFGPKEDKLRLVESIYRDSIGFFIATFVKTK